MLSILSLDTAADTHEYRVPTREEEIVMEFQESDSEAVAEEAAEADDFEIVMGRRQVASVLFVATVIVAIFSSVSYLAGKSISPKKAADVPAAIVLTPTPAENALPPAAAAPSIPTVTATIAPAPAPRPVGPQNPMDGPLFAEPVIGSVYIQMAAVEKGIAVVFAEGLRRHGLQSFVAPGPNDTLHRVLIGPLPNPASYASAKDELDRMGLTTFARKYEK